MVSAFVEEQRRAVPISQFITSSSSDGILMSMNVYIDSSKLDEYINIVAPVVRKLREYPECIFCEISKNPNDQGHIRVLHGWKKPSDWFRDVRTERTNRRFWEGRERSLILLAQQNIEVQPWFGDYIKALAPVRDVNRARKLPAPRSP